MDEIKVLVVDDSDFTRSFIIDLLTEDPLIRIVGEASNGKEAFSKVLALRPDIVTMDIQMPELDGISAIEMIMSTLAVPILVVTSKSDAATAYNAISKGALEVMEKPTFDAASSREFIRKVKYLAKVKVITHLSLTSQQQKSYQPKNITAKPTGSEKIIAIASSTGGPQALSIILKALPANLECPIVIAQHIPDDFIAGMTDWLQKCVTLKVQCGMEGELLQPGTIYISPAEKHMKINKQKQIVYQERSIHEIYFPSCNILLSSSADVYGTNCIGLILTGMGNDGVIGMNAIKKAGGITISQDETTSVIFGMPKAAIESGCIDLVLPLDKIAAKLITLIKKRF